MKTSTIEKAKEFLSSIGMSERDYGNIVEVKTSVLLPFSWMVEFKSDTSEGSIMSSFGVLGSTVIHIKGKPPVEYNNANRKKLKSSNGMNTVRSIVWAMFVVLCISVMGGGFYIFSLGMTPKEELLSILLLLAPVYPFSRYVLAPTLK